MWVGLQLLLEYLSNIQGQDALTNNLVFDDSLVTSLRIILLWCSGISSVLGARNPGIETRESRRSGTQTQKVLVLGMEAVAN